MKTSYHYEFDNILDLKNVIYKISIPELHDGAWLKEICYALIESVTIQVSIYDLILDELVIDLAYRKILDELEGKSINKFVPTSNSLIWWMPLFPYDIYKTFGYLSKCLEIEKYKIICDVKINDKPNIQFYCIRDKEDVEPTLNGQFQIEEIIYEPKIVIRI